MRGKETRRHILSMCLLVSFNSMWILVSDAGVGVRGESTEFGFHGIADFKRVDEF